MSASIYEPDQFQLIAQKIYDDSIKYDSKKPYFIAFYFLVTHGINIASILHARNYQYREKDGKTYLILSPSATGFSIATSKDTKKNCKRLEITKEINDIFEKAIEHRSDDRMGFLFQTKNGTSYYPQSFSRYLSNLRDKYEVSDLTVPNLRNMLSKEPELMDFSTFNSSEPGSFENDTYESDSSLYNDIIEIFSVDDEYQLIITAVNLSRKQENPELTRTLESLQRKIATKYRHLPVDAEYLSDKYTQKEE